LLILSFAMLVTPAGAVASSCGEVRSYRATSSSGTPVLVLTNLDEEGNRLGAPCPWEPEPPLPSPAPAISSAGGAGTGPAAGGVSVLVNRGDGEPSDAQQVEVKTDDHGGTTVIVNINPPPPAKETV